MRKSDQEIVSSIKKLLFFNFTILSATFFFLVWTAPTSCRAQQSYVFGVHPYKKPTALKKSFTPLINYLAKETGATITFRSAKSYAALMNSLVNNEIDISYIGPAPFATWDLKHPGKIRLAAVGLNYGKPTFHGVIVAKESSPINTISDLTGARFAFGDRQSTLSCILPAAMLIKAGIFNQIEYKFTGSHDNVAKGILSGLFHAGGMKPSIAQKYVGNGLKIIAQTENVYEHCIGVSSRVDDQTLEKIRHALINTPDPKIYKSIKKDFTGFGPVSPVDFDNLKDIILAVDQALPQ